MADYVTAPAHLESAVSAVLGDRLQGIVVDGPAVGAGGVNLLKQLLEGRTTFLPRMVRLGENDPVSDTSPKTAWRSPEEARATGAGGIEVVDLSADAGGAVTEAVTEAVVETGADGAARSRDGATVGTTDGLEALCAREGVLGPLVELVELDAQAATLGAHLLGDTVVVDGLPRALELLQEGALDRTLVTLDGDRIEPSGIVVGGSAEALDSALLQQKREIKELETVVATLSEELDAAKRRHQGLAERLDAVERGREASEAETLELEKGHLAATQRVERLEETAGRATRELERREAQQQAATSEATLARDDVERLTTEQERLEASLPALQSRIEEAGEQVTSLEGRRESVQAELSEARVALARWQQDRAALASTRERLQKQVGSERERVRRLSQSVETWRARVSEIEASVAQLETEHAAHLVTHKTATEAKISASEACEELRVELAEVEASLKNLRGSLEEERTALGEVELGLRELELERSHVAEDISLRYDRAVEDVLIDFHDRRVAGPEEQKQIAQLKRLLSRMGEVNLTAIREYDEVSERYEYLTGQRTDLEDAIAQLTDAIDRINQTTRERFKETFEQVNAHFKDMFPRMFSGGRAELVMTAPSDLLGTGVEILAQPPGKKVVSLELLSGGEKALTAVSLIFAIFLNKPSPFCLLDEVDAPLDEANVGRFCDVVRELSLQTQFIIITHNKRTMETADRLYGVTMQQRGVSKLVSVNLRRSVEEARLN